MLKRDGYQAYLASVRDKHEIEFSRGSRWRIERRDIEWAWHANSSGTA
jgi:hypothetical protein